MVAINGWLYKQHMSFDNGQDTLSGLLPEGRYACKKCGKHAVKPASVKLGASRVAYYCSCGGELSNEDNRNK